MVKGAFVVSPLDTDPRQIHFQTRKDVEATSEQLLLKSEVEKTLVVIQMLFLATDKRYFDYYNPLLSLTQCGLVGDYAQPEVARRALAELKSEIVAREGGNVKNRYLKQLGLMAFISGGVSSLLGSVLLLVDRDNLMSSFCFLWLGSMIGVWLSFGSRKTQLTFEELAIPETDRLEPLIRLVFAGLFTCLFGLIFVLKLVIVSIGEIKSFQLDHNLTLAILLGAFCGFSELALPTKFASQASRLLSFK
jgi:hypothetical protein